MTDLEDLRTTAYDWHSGMWSPLYALASSGIILDVPELLSEIQMNLAHHATLRSEANRLEALKQYVMSLPSSEGVARAYWAIG
jgi:hypothetical protein